MDNKRLITIAIDGFSSSGKSTMAKKLAKTIGYAYIDTGAMYRAVTLYCLRNGLFDGDRLDTERLEAALPDINITFGVDADGKTQTMLNGEVVEQEIRRMSVSAAKEIKDRIRQELKFTVNIGISYNKLLAKMASDFEKPDKCHNPLGFFPPRGEGVTESQGIEWDPWP